MIAWWRRQNPINRMMEHIREKEARYGDKKLW